MKNKVNFLEEKNHKSLRIIAQSDNKFENMLNIDKSKGDMHGIGYEDNVSKPNTTPYNRVGPKNASYREKYPIQVGKNIKVQRNSNFNASSSKGHIREIE